MIKKRPLFLLVIIGLFIFCSLVLPNDQNSFSQDSPTMSQLGEKFSAEKAYGHIQYLAEKIGPRPAGSAQERQAAQYIYYILEQSGWQVTHQPFSKVVVNPNPLDPEHKVQVINSQNIIAELPGTHPETILLGAHYDSASVYAPGALDNASGVGVLLEIARILATEKHEKTYQIVFFGAEEMGLVGSNYFVNQRDLSAVQWMLNLDMVGTPLEVDIAGKNSAPPDLVQQIAQILQQADVDFHISRDFAVMTRDGIQGGSSDFSPFLDQRIPAIGLGLAGRADGFYHRPEDRIEGVTLQSLETVGGLIPKLLAEVEIEGSGQKDWDSYYLPFQIGPYFLILPSIALKSFLILVLLFTALTFGICVRGKNPLGKGEVKDYLLISLVTLLGCLALSFLSGTGEFLWQKLKNQEILWNAYPEIFFGLRLLLLIVGMILIGGVLKTCPRPQGGNYYWLVGTGILAVLSIFFGLYRIDLAFPLVFWLLCFTLIYYFPNFLILLLGPYFIYITHWELLNSQQWSSFYETVHKYPLIFGILYALLFIPIFLGVLAIFENSKRPWEEWFTRFRVPALMILIAAILFTGTIPSYSKNNPQPISVEKVWTEGESLKLHLISQDSIPQSIVRQLRGKDITQSKKQKVLEVPIPQEKSPLVAKMQINDTGNRNLQLQINLNSREEPYLIRVKLVSSQPFTITKMDEFIPISKLPRKVTLEGKENKGMYSLVLERTPPHKENIQWQVAAPGTLKCYLEVVFADENPQYLIQSPRISPNYLKKYQDVFEI